MSLALCPLRNVLSLKTLGIWVYCMITALILASNLILKEEQWQREHSRRRDTGVHTTELPGHPITLLAFSEDNPLPTFCVSQIYSTMNS